MDKQVSGKVKILTGGNGTTGIHNGPIPKPATAKAADPVRIRANGTVRMEETELNMSVSSPSNTSNTAADQAADKPMTRPDNAHSTGVADSGRWSTKRIAMYALFVALSMAVSFIDSRSSQACSGSIRPIRHRLPRRGLRVRTGRSVIVSVLGFVPHLFTNPWGTLMAVLVALALSVPASLIYKKNKTRKAR